MKDVGSKRRAHAFVNSRLGDPYCSLLTKRRHEIGDWEGTVKNEFAALAGHATAENSVGATQVLAQWVSEQSNASLTANALTWAKHVLLDWTAVTIAGYAQPLVQMLVAEYGGAADGPCSLLVGNGRARAVDAALINGSAGHALDFDDVAARMFGHPSVPVVPAALALAQAQHGSALTYCVH
jgi:MmgE/PrpD N-terminal domain